MITINLLKGRETKQSFFEFGGDFERVDLERAYATLAWEERKRVLEEETGFDFDELNFYNKVDTDFQEVWIPWIEAHDAHAEIPRLEARIESAKKAWQKRLSTPVPDYLQFINDQKGDASWTFIELVDIEIVKRLNRTVAEFNALTQEQKAKNWFQYVARTKIILGNKTPYFILTKGCKNCGTGKDLQEKGFNHEVLAGCLIYGCLVYGHDGTHPFFDPEDVLEKALESGDPEGLKNARQYIADVKGKYGTCYEDMDICLDSMIEELDANISPEE